MCSRTLRVPSKGLKKDLLAATERRRKDAEWGQPGARFMGLFTDNKSRQRQAVPAKESRTLSYCKYFFLCLGFCFVLNTFWGWQDDRWRHLLPNLTAWMWALGSTSGKERTDSWKLSCEPHMYDVAELSRKINKLKILKIYLYIKSLPSPHLCTRQGGACL